MANGELIKQFLDNRFGMFIHWGVYSTLGGEWRGATVQDDLGEWIMNVLQIPVKEYEKIASRFYPLNFDAEAYVKLAHNAGMRYIVITAKHHDGFAMFRSECDPYNIYDWTDYKRDVIDDLAKACKKYGIKLGFYYSQALDWHEEHAGGWAVKPYGLRESWGNIWDYPENDKKDFSIYFEKKVKPQVRELLTKYGDVFLLWFDTPRTITTDQSEELYQLVKSLQPNCLVNSRIGNGKGDYGSLGDNQIPTMTLEKPNESPVTLNDTWGYKHYDHNWKSSEEIIDMLAKLASKNVNFLLNIGPMGDGNLTTETIRILNGISEWTSLNGEAIYNTSGNSTPFDFDWGYITTNENKVYMCFKENKEQVIEFNGLLSKVKKIYSLENKKDLVFEKNQDDTLKISIPKTKLYMPVYVIECEETPEFHKHLLQQNNSLTLYPLTSKIYDGKLKDAKSIFMESRHVNYDSYGKIKVDWGGNLTGWSKSYEYIEWEAEFVKSGNYSVEIISNSIEVDYTKVSEKTRNESECQVEFSLINDSENDGTNNAQSVSGYKLRTNLKEDFVYSESRSSAYNTRIGTICGNIDIKEVGLYRIKLRLINDLKDQDESIPLVALRCKLQL